MRILILGGSNAALAGGWATEFARRAEGHVVHNRFLGAVGSLFALVRLTKMEREGGDWPDILVLEYLLNDILLHVHSRLDLDMLADGLAEIAAHGARRRMRVLALGLEPRLGRSRRARRRAASVRQVHQHVLGSCGVPLLHAAEALGRSLRDLDYVDDNHPSPEVSARIAAALLDAVERGRPAVPRALPAARPRFAFVDAADARAEGRSEWHEVRATVYAGPFLRLARPSSSRWPGSGQVAALLVRSDATSGPYRIGAGCRSRRKNASTVALDAVPRPILLHYLRRRLLADGDLVVGMPGREAELTLLADDPTLLERPPLVPFAEQTVEIGGVVLWRPPSRWRRVLSGLGRALRRPRAALRRPPPGAGDAKPLRVAGGSSTGMAP